MHRKLPPIPRSRDACRPHDDLGAARGIAIASLSGAILWALMALAFTCMVSPG